MAEFYLDVSAIGNEYQAYADTPTTWGVPQDGNGKAGPGHAAAVAIATIDCNGASASGTGTVGVLGVTVSSTLNASGAALATAIVTAINASATATAAGVSAALLPLNRLVFARVNPVLNTQVQIMLRIAGTDWNGLTPTRANITGGGVTSFAGGANGPFGYLATLSTVFGKTARGYGVLTPLKVAAVTDPGALDDVIHVRTRRSGADLTVTMNDGTARYDWFFNPAATNRNFMFDDGTLWASDAGLFTLAFYTPAAISGGSNTLQTTSSTQTSFSSRSGRRFRLYADVLAGANGYEFRSTSNRRIWDGVIFEESPTCVGAGFRYAQASVGNTFWQMSNSKWIAKGSRNLGGTSSNPGAKCFYYNCEFEYFGLSADVTNIIDLNLGSQDDMQFRFIGCKFYDRNGVYGIVSPILGGVYPSQSVIVEFDGCTGVTNVSSGWAGTPNDHGRQLLWENFGPDRDWRVESGQWLAEWRHLENFPTLTSIEDGGGPWSAKVLLRNTMTWGHPQKILKLPGRYRASSAVRTVTLEYLAQLAFTKSQLGLLFAYIDSDDVVRFESTLESHAQQLLGGTAHPTSSAVWTLNGTGGYTAYKMALTTQYPIKTGSKFVAFVLAAGTIAGDQSIFFNGEVDLT